MCYVQTPFVLLYLNRDDDCFSFIRYWVIEDGNDDGTAREQLHANSQPGDWLYGHHPGCRFQDMRKFFPDQYLPKFVSLYFVVALMVIKMRIIAQHNARTRILGVFTMAKFGRGLPKPIRAYIGSFHTYDAALISAQKQQLDALLAYIHAANPVMLPSLVNPPKSRGSPSQFEQSGHLSEARDVFNASSRCVARVPDAHKRIQVFLAPAVEFYSNGKPIVPLHCPTPPGECMHGCKG